VPIKVPVNPCAATVRVDSAHTAHRRRYAAARIVDGSVRGDTRPCRLFVGWPEANRVPVRKGDRDHEPDRALAAGRRRAHDRDFIADLCDPAFCAATSGTPTMASAQMAPRESIS